MSEREKISPLVRVASGVIGILGFSAVAFSASRDGGLVSDVLLIASFFAGFVFLYVSFFGRYPWDKAKADDTSE